MRILTLTREYPPHVYGGAGVHVEHLTRELAQLATVEVRCFGEQHIDGAAATPAVRGFTPFAVNADQVRDQMDGRLWKAVEPLITDLAILQERVEADVVHCHTWYSMMAGLWIKILYDIPLVVTTHSLEPLRPWKEDQLGRGYQLSQWIERTAIEAADARLKPRLTEAAIIDILAAIPDDLYMDAPEGRTAPFDTPDANRQAYARFFRQRLYAASAASLVQHVLAFK